MTVAKCPRCGAVVTAQLLGSELKVSHGANFLTTCPQIKDRLAAGEVCVAAECSVMEIAVRRVESRTRASGTWRSRKKAAAVVSDPSVPSQLESGGI